MDSTWSVRHLPILFQLRPALAAALRAVDRQKLRRALEAPLARRLLRYWRPLAE